ncbi:MAG: hypothetical protein WAZ34_16955 [Rhodocyclaceae bacterium]
MSQDGAPIDLRHGKDYGIATAEGPRSCGTCRNLSAGHACLAALRGLLDYVTGEYRPWANAPRRCLGYVPSPGCYDDRTGLQLWPEIANYVEGGEGARGYLAAQLTGGPVPSALIIAKAGEAGFPKRTIQRAAEQLGVVRAKRDFSHGWDWSIP